jgi:hypothetical protein
MGPWKAGQNRSRMDAIGAAYDPVGFLQGSMPTDDGTTQERFPDLQEPLPDLADFRQHVTACQARAGSRACCL